MNDPDDEDFQDGEGEEAPLDDDDLDPADSDMERDDEDDEPVGSCDICGNDLYPDDDEDLCEDCLSSSLGGEGAPKPDDSREPPF